MSEVYPETPLGSPPAAAATPAGAGTPDEFGGHEFAYEQANDLFRCTRCRAYEVTVRNDNGEFAPCPGDVPGEPMVLNAW